MQIPYGPLSLRWWKPPGVSTVYQADERLIVGVSLFMWKPPGGFPPLDQAQRSILYDFRIQSCIETSQNNEKKLHYLQSKKKFDIIFLIIKV